MTVGRIPSRSALPPGEEPSKSQRKRDMTALQALGERLTELPASQLEALPLDEDLRDAVLLARRISSHEGRRRQMQLIGKLMRNIDAAPIAAAIGAVDDQRRSDARSHLIVEQWRDSLLGDDANLPAFCERFDTADAAKLKALIARARHERSHELPPRAGRELFRRLREAIAARN